ncbi:hypothetical protein F2Q70_00010942 [Brassica cretica]|uniref:Uncharacterized protein n=1 Tax=Brassica cretica TaxID=69181 RepID=A0A8S9LY87_BRACR|nr:hypothetical protein F2Q70_00010942 [Brassica cretica]
MSSFHSFGTANNHTLTHVRHRDYGSLDDHSKSTLAFPCTTSENQRVAFRVADRTLQSFKPPPPCIDLTDLRENVCRNPSNPKSQPISVNPPHTARQNSIQPSSPPVSDSRSFFDLQSTKHLTAGKPEVKEVIQDAINEMTDDEVEDEDEKSVAGSDEEKEEEEKNDEAESSKEKDEEEEKAEAESNKEKDEDEEKLKD